MEGIDFAVSGAENFQDYEYGQACETEISFFSHEPSYDAQVIMTMKSIQERVLQNHTQKYTFSTIDNVVKVKTLNSQIRAQKVDFWKARRAEMWTLGSAGMVGVVGSAFLAVTTGGALAGILGMTSIAASILGVYRGYQASDQIARWNLDLPIAIANQRKVALEEGLFHILRQDETGKSYPVTYSSILTSTELQGLYYTYFRTLVRTFEQGGSVKDQLSIIQQVAMHGPLCSHVYSYAKLHPQHVERLMFYIEEHNKVIKAFNSIEKRRFEQKKQVSDAAYKQICSIEKEKNVALAVIDKTYHEYKKQLEGEKMAVFDKNLESREAIAKEFDHKLSGAKQLYDLGRAAIGSPFQMQRENIEKERDRFIHQIQYNHDAQILSFYNYVKLLHLNAYRTCMGQSPLTYPTWTDPCLISFQPLAFTIPLSSSYEAIFAGIRDQYRLDEHVYNEFINIYKKVQGSE